VRSAFTVDAPWILPLALDIFINTDAAAIASISFGAGGTVEVLITYWFRFLLGLSTRAINLYLAVPIVVILVRFIRFSAGRSTEIANEFVFCEIKARTPVPVIAKFEAILNSFTLVSFSVLASDC